MKDLMRTFWNDESGQDLAEYGLLLVLIALAVILAITAFRNAIRNAFDSATEQLDSAS